jgi:hypothetical protein
MAKPRSFVDSMCVEIAKNSHNCRHNKKHRIAAGHKRLSVSDGMSHQTYCVPCAVIFLERDITTIRNLIASLQGDA